MKIPPERLLVSNHRTQIGWMVAALLGLAILVVLWRPLHRVTKATASAGSAQSGTASQDQVLLAAPGRIEGLTEVTEVGSGVDGVLAEVTVKEGQHVEAGTIVARIDRPDLQAEVRAANDALESARQSRVRLVREAVRKSAAWQKRRRALPKRPSNRLSNSSRATTRFSSKESCRTISGNNTSGTSMLRRLICGPPRTTND